jgi:hypothetical protein
MLRLFRTLRRRLLEESSVRTYALYALGEILLLVIGILLALQINAWNEQRVDAARERDYLGLLRQELQSNVDFIQGFYLDRYARKVEALEMVRAHHQGRHEIEDSTRFAVEAGYGAVFGSRTFRASTAVFDEIVSTGNLGILRDEELRRRLIAYYGQVEAFMQALRVYESEYLRTVNGIRPFDVDRPDAIAPFERDLMIEQKKTEAMYHAATLELTYAHQAAAFMRRIKSDAEEIIGMIEGMTPDR